MKQPLRHPRLGADHDEAEKPGYHCSVMSMSLMCRDELQRFGFCWPVELAVIYCSADCSPCYIHCVATAVLTPLPRFVLWFSLALFVALQSMKLVHLPQTLTIHLKRFCFEQSAYIHKLSHHLPFPQELDVNAVLTENQCQADDNEKVRYS